MIQTPFALIFKPEYKALGITNILTLIINHEYKALNIINMLALILSQEYKALGNTNILCINTNTFVNSKHNVKLNLIKL